MTAVTGSTPVDMFSAETPGRDGWDGAMIPTARGDVIKASELDILCRANS